MPINIIKEMQAGVLPDVNSTQLFLMDVERFLDSLPEEPIFDFVVTSPPYNIGKEYENQMPLADYVAWQKRITHIFLIIYVFTFVSHALYFNPMFLSMGYSFYAVGIKIKSAMMEIHVQSSL